VPSASQHRAWAIQNVGVYRALRADLSPWRDWALTVLFYVAVHDLKAFFAANRGYFSAQGKKLPETHGELKAALRKNPAWKPLAKHYEGLLGKSKRTRYGCWTPSEGDLATYRKALRAFRREIKRM
jgi:hypothetical protein